MDNPVERVLREGVVIGLANHTVLISRQGNDLPIADSGAPILNNQGDITGVVLVFRDQSQERAAQREHALLTYTISTSLNEIYLFDADTLHFRFANTGALRNLGYTLEQMQSKTPVELKPQLTFSQFQQLLKPLLAHEKPNLVFETFHQRADSSLYPIEVHLQLFEFEKEKVFLSVIQDITLQRKAAEALAEKEHQFHSLFDNMIEGVALHELVVDESGRPVDYILVDANRQFETHTGFQSRNPR